MSVLTSFCLAIWKLGSFTPIVRQWFRHLLSAWNKRTFSTRHVTSDMRSYLKKYILRTNAVPLGYWYNIAPQYHQKNDNSKILCCYRKKLHTKKYIIYYKWTNLTKPELSCTYENGKNKIKSAQYTMVNRYSLTYSFHFWIFSIIKWNIELLLT